MIHKKLNYPFFLLLISIFFVCEIALAQDGKPTFTIQPKDYQVPETEGVTTKVLSDEKVLSITADGLKKSLVIPINTFAAQPNTAYQVRYQLLAKDLSENANIYILIREHKEEKSRAITPYHKESIRVRELKSDATEKWNQRKLNFTTGAETHFLSGSIVIDKLKGTLHLSPFELWTEANSAAQAAKLEQEALAQTQAAYDKKMAQIRAQAAGRKRLVPQTLVFSRAQIKYKLGRNYYHDWNDRPLLASRDYRVLSPYIAPLPSYKRTLEEMVNNYNINGLAFFPQTKDRMKTYREHSEANVPNAQLLTEIFAPSTPSVAAASGFKDKVIADMVEAVQLALKNPAAARVNGKLLITSYNAQSTSPENWKLILDNLREHVGDTFVFLPALANLQPTHKKYFLKGEPAPVAEIEKLEDFLRSYLDVCDGIYYNYPPALYKKDHTFDADYYREVMIPVMKSVLNEPKYREKYLGLSAYKSHVNPTAGNNLYQDGTRTLRGSLGTAIAAQPDVIVLPEWDEQNENSSWRPTIYGAHSNARITRYYMSQATGKTPSPLPNDDTNIPNLTLSSRKIAVIGEKIFYELLNIPDGSQGTYSAQLSLEDENGNTVKTFDKSTFDAAELREKRFYLATETVPQVRALNPVLKIEGYKGHNFTFDEGLHAVQLRATWNWDFLDVNQPLRDILRPVKASIQWEKPIKSGEPLILTGQVSASENLNTVEVLGDDDEAFAVDKDNEFFRNDPDRELILMEYRSLLPLKESLKGEVSLKNATAHWLNNGTILHQQETDFEVRGEKVELSTPVSFHSRWIYLAVPKKDIAKGELIFDSNVAKFTVPLRDIFEKKMMARAFDGGLNITLRPYRRQIDMPVSLNQKSTSFRVPIYPEIASEQYHLRITTADGKIYRTRPILLPTTQQSEQTKLRVYSETQKCAVDVQIAKDRIPDLKYDFDATRGAVLLTNAGQPFWGSLGGFDDATTGRGRINGIGHVKHNSYPDEVKRSDPQWGNENGTSYLEFNGKSTFIALPRETLPFKGAFTLEFDVNPSSTEDQTLLANAAVGRQTGLLLRIKDGNLSATLPNADWNTNSLNTQLPVPVGKWSHITVQRDFEKLTLSIDGKSESVESLFPSRNIGYLIVGGLGKSWFEGKIKNLEIMHNAAL